MVNYSQNKGGDGACPLPLPTPAPCDSLVLPVQRVIATGGFKSVGGKPKAMSPGTLESEGKREVNPFKFPRQRVFFLPLASRI
jgi:hypothetical protein